MEVKYDANIVDFNISGNRKVRQKGVASSLRHDG